MAKRVVELAEHELTADEAVGKVVDDLEEEVQDEVTLSSGAIVRAKRVPDNLLLAWQRQHQAPKPPIVTIEQEGRRPRREENPNDPDYIQATETYQIEVAAAMTDFIHLTGMEIISLPEGMKAYEEDDEWADELEAVGIDIPTSKASRKLLWIRYKVAPSSDDLTLISSVYSQAVQEVDEEEVAIKEGQFPSEAGGATG